MPSGDNIHIDLMIPRSMIQEVSRDRRIRRRFQDFVGDVLTKVADMFVQRTYDTIKTSILHSYQLVINSECAVCLDPLRLFSNVCIPPCKHGFHTQCMEEVIKHRFESCPVCRQEF
jgi:hypothetical protein